MRAQVPHLQHTGIKFATLMRELALNNGGTFVGLNAPFREQKKISAHILPLRFNKILALPPLQINLGCSELPKQRYSN